MQADIRITPHGMTIDWLGYRIHIVEGELSVTDKDDEDVTADFLELGVEDEIAENLSLVIQRIFDAS